ncbi:YGGT family protein [Caloramator mitchellensis]|uniref:YGGT family protein n=1 Tax=Caloramator mitchellensis TaxID=908809 RepID=A0A0R3JST2_CALMK|nr:YggT family protein [Caloramator mitchellensis]KRQ86560.1 YGGT family protein [Caloramator mitchellensis]
MIYTLFRAVNLFIDLLEWLIFIQVIASWFPQIRRNQIFRYIDLIVEPVMAPFRSIQFKLMPNTMIDFSPIFAYIALEFIRRILVNILF